MNKFRIILLLVLSFIFGNMHQGFTQDIHFSQFLYSPLNLNPANAGNFDGRYRFAFNYKNQWRSISKAFQTTSISGDARNFLNVKNLGLGALFYYDITGTSRYKTMSFAIPVSYRINLTKDSAHALIPGLAPSFNQQSIDVSALTSDNQFNGFRYDPDIGSNENYHSTSNNYIDAAAGINYQYRAKNALQITIGAAVNNITEPTQNFLQSDQSRLMKRFAFHASAYVPLHKQWFLTPGIIHSRQAPHSEWVYGSEINFLHSATPYRYRAFFVGGWNRGKDAGIVNLGMYYNSWRVGLSYDVNYSALTVASERRGGWEVSVIYILRELLPKRSNFKFCPNYI